ncbi:energy transducer TonB [Pandoraea sp.]|uniref:energy transducer TonB n=1 Tax=Pandoraea sp. TaxID=1883445 RepID=UPI0025DB5560|nr:energy transducer TonB [Pandoraea sp.]
MRTISPRAIRVFAAVALLHAGALLLLLHLPDPAPAPATITTPAIMATLLPITPRPAPASRPAIPPAPEAAKPRVQPKPVPTAIRVKRTEPAAQPSPRPSQAPRAAPAARPDTRATRAAPASVAATAGPAPPAAPVEAPPLERPIEGLKVSCAGSPPVYPREAASLGEEGTVRLRLVIDKDGTIEQAKVIASSGSARLDRAARDAALAMHCEPPRSDGQPVKAAAVKPYTFRLDNQDN